MNDHSNDDGYETIFRPWRRDKNGNKIWAKQFGKKAFPIRVKKDGKSED